MPPEKSNVKKSSYDKKPAASSSRKTKDDVKDVRSSRDKNVNKTRESSTSRISKDKPQKDDVKTRTSVREKISALKNEAEKTKTLVRERKDAVVKPKGSQSSSRIKPEASNRSSKPTSLSGKNTTAGDSLARRTQLSYHSSRVAEKPKMTPLRGDVRKNIDVSTKSKLKKTETAQKSSVKKEVSQRAKLPDKMIHPQSTDSRSRGRQTQKVEEPNRLGRDRTRTRTLSPAEVKMGKGEPEEKPRSRNEESKESGPVVAVAGPSTSRQHEQSGGDVLQHQDSDYDDYEDDFEDYESDFEEESDTDTTDEGADINNDGFSSDLDSDSSESESELRELTPRQHPVVEEEKKLDSGNYDLAERRRKGRELQEIKLAMEKENETLHAQRNSKTHVENLPVPADEGYEEGKTDENKKFSSPVTHLSFINFANARKRKQEKKVTETVKKRGEELLGMIQLDTVSFTLFDLPPIPYEVYMKSYGRSNTLQAHAQTNEDDLSQEVQTDEIVYKNKWTQKPVSFETKSHSKKTKSGKEDIILFSQENLGVGGDTLEDDPDSWKQRIKVNTVRLNQFLSSAGQKLLEMQMLCFETGVMLMLLEEGQKSGSSMLNRNTMEVPFSEGFISLGVESVPLLAGTSVKSLRFPLHHSMILLTVHKNNVGINVM
ncbi:hypothetical protein L9F63_020123 [Diploptera punctata]|uniref:Uncharacterized protein n=1 Tax=Diploptera punctata TaxID=6984 RepID=A0AAD8EDU9_DIPPU|nr:hypothetical protein L9F63_020123 [Diploptera punctata]